VLSLVSSSVGIAVTGGGSRALEHVYFSRLSNQKIVAVVVTRNGVVRDRVLRLQRDMSQAELEMAARYINENFRGWSMDQLKTEIGRRIQQERAEYDQLLQSVRDLYEGGALAVENAPQAVFVEGVSNLVVKEEDRERLHRLLRALEEKEKIAELLSAYVSANQEAVRVVIGLEDAAPEMRNLVLIGAPARVGEEVMGSLAVIGPTRMDYEHTITAVSYIARLFDKILNEPEKG
jgi:heat-inducible transcriptional repressor